MDSTLIAGLIGAFATIAAAVIGLLKLRKQEGAKQESARQESVKVNGKLLISEIVVLQNKKDKTCLLDFRVHNEGGSDVLVNRLMLEVMDTCRIFTLGYMEFSETYDLDISQLKEVGDKAECSIAQIVKPGEADRFGITLIAKDLGTGFYRGWKLIPTLYSNFGSVVGKPVEVWLPYALEGATIEKVKPFSDLWERWMSGKITSSEYWEQVRRLEQSADLREQLTVLREELVSEREASAELRRIIAGLVQRVPELEAASQSRESAVIVSKDEGNKVPTEPEHRSWWQRMFGG